MTIEAFLNELGAHRRSIQEFFVAVASRLGVPYEHEREREHVLKVRHEGQWVPGEHGGQVWDSGKDYSHSNWPDSFNGVEEALKQIHRPVAMWFHVPSLNLVILDESGAKVGIRSTCLRIFLFGLHMANVRVLVEGLQAKLTAS